MCTKRAAIVLLVGLNLLLLLAMILSTWRLPTALAQAGGRGGSLASVTANVAGQSYDVLYVLDASAQKLYAVYPGGGRDGKLMASNPRDLREDFGN